MAIDMSSPLSSSTSEARNPNSSSMYARDTMVANENRTWGPTEELQKQDVPVGNAEGGLENRASEPNLKRLMSKPASLRRAQSCGDGHRYQCFGDDDRGHVEEIRQQEEFEVQWEGDNDLMHPRSSGKARKWTIVLIVSLSSACVYVNSTCRLRQDLKVKGPAPPPCILRRTRRSQRNFIAHE